MQNTHHRPDSSVLVSPSSIEESCIFFSGHVVLVEEGDCRPYCGSLVAPRPVPRAGTLQYTAMEWYLRLHSASTLHSGTLHLRHINLVSRLLPFLLQTLHRFWMATPPASAMFTKVWSPRCRRSTGSAIRCEGRNVAARWSPGGSGTGRAASGAAAGTSGAAWGAAAGTSGAAAGTSSWSGTSCGAGAGAGTSCGAGAGAGVEMTTGVSGGGIRSGLRGTSGSSTISSSSELSKGSWWRRRAGRGLTVLSRSALCSRGRSPARGMGPVMEGQSSGLKLTSPSPAASRNLEWDSLGLSVLYSRYST